jgi:hypothetical protein
MMRIQADPDLDPQDSNKQIFLFSLSIRLMAIRELYPEFHCPAMIITIFQIFLNNNFSEDLLYYVHPPCLYVGLFFTIAEIPVISTCKNQEISATRETVS